MSRRRVKGPISLIVLGKTDEHSGDLSEWVEAQFADVTTPNEVAARIREMLSALDDENFGD